MKPLEQAAANMANEPDSIFGIDLTPFKAAIIDAAKRIEALEKQVAALSAAQLK
jgi:hypothetical protein